MDKRKIIDRFVEFFLNEQRLRWQIYLISGTVALAWALVRVFVTHKAEEEVGLEVAMLLCILLLISVVTYVARGSHVERIRQLVVSPAPGGPIIGLDKIKPFKKEEIKPGERPHLSRRLGIACAIALALLIYMAKVNVPMMQAAIADFRLQALATFPDQVQAANLSDQQIRARYQKIESVVGASFANQIPVDPVLLRGAQTAISRSLKDPSVSSPTKELGLRTAIDLESLVYTRDLQTGIITPVTPPKLTNSPGYFLSSTVVLNQELYIRGDHSLFIGSGGEFVIENASIVFDSIDFRSFTTEPAIVLRGKQSNVLVRNSILKNVTQYLDRITWVDVQFESSRILYTEGAPLRLRNVSFRDCDISISQLHFPPDMMPPPAGPVSAELVKRIREANGGQIDFVYEPEAAPDATPAR